MGFTKQHGMSVWEPAANRGFMVKGLSDYFDTVYASDIHDYGVGYPVHDFLHMGLPPYEPNWIITNPPFNIAQDFVETALHIAETGVAVILRSVWAEGIGRYNRVFSKKPPTIILQNVERVPMQRGEYNPDGTSATSYSWFVWNKANMNINNGLTLFDWIPPAKKRLYKPGDENYG